MTKFLPQTKEALLRVLFAVTTMTLITANLCAIKNEAFLGISLGGGIATIVIDYIVSDMCAEVFGFKKAIAMRRAAMLCNVASVLVLQAVVLLPADPEFAIQGEFSTIFTTAPIMVAASMVAYMVGTYVNDKIMQRLHDQDGDRGLFKRCIASTVFGGFADTAVFTIIAYGFTYSTVSNIENTLLTYVLKIAIEAAVFTLVTKKVIAWAKKLPSEGAA